MKNGDTNQRGRLNKSLPEFYYNHISYTDTAKFHTHCHNEYEMLFFISGSAKYLIEGRTYPLKKYDLIITRPMQYHNIELECSEKYSRYDVLITHSPELVSMLSSLSEKFEVVNCAELPNVVECFKKIDYYHKHLPRVDFNIILNNLLVEVCYNLIINDTLASKEPVPSSKVVLAALDYINANLFTIKDIKEVCEHVFLSENHFFKLFKEQMKTSPKKYITSKRLLSAQRMLLDGARPTNIYEQCGFNNYISFYQRYTEYFGHAPSEERHGD